MIDTHTHLYAEEFEQDRREVIEKALQQGVQQFLLPAIDSETHEKKCFCLKKNILIGLLQ